MMLWLLTATFKVSILVALALAAAALMRRRSAACRHWVLAVGVGCALALPIVEMVAPAWQWPGPVARPTRTEVQVDTIELSIDGIPAQQESVTPAPRALSTAIPAPLDLLGILWLAGALFSLAALLMGLRRLALLTARARRADARWDREASEAALALGLRKAVRVLQTDHPAVLVTFGLRRHTVLLPSDAGEWSDERVRVVVGHELAHVARADWAIQSLAELLRCLYWFNPLLWLACRRVRQESEHACDDEVLRRGVGGAAYAGHLVELAQAFSAHHRPFVPAPGAVRPSTLRKRISAMLNDRLDRTPMTRSVRLLTLAILIAATSLVAGLGAQTFATLRGTIVDSTGGIMPDTSVTLSSADTTSKYEVRSSDAGAFEFVGLPAGTYRLEAKALGFANFQQELTIVAGETRAEAIVMQVGTLQETINVARPSGANPEPRRSQRAEVSVPACTPEPVGGRIVPPKKILNVPPQYPASLEPRETPTRVALEARIDTQGMVRDVRVLSPADPDLDAAATKAVLGWRFTPTLLNCVPIDVFMKVSVTFQP